MKDSLEIKNLFLNADGKKILEGVNLTINKGEIHVLMGPNGAGKTSLVLGLMGYPKYKIASGQILFEGKDIQKLTTDERARLGLFISFQKPVEVPGITLRNLLKKIIREDFDNKFLNGLSELKIDEELLNRSFENFSGGEGKKLELFQVKMLDPRFIILDEIDSGLDIDALRLVAGNINSLIRRKNPPGILLVTHYPKILRLLKPDYIHVLLHGKIVQSGGPKMASVIEKRGYQWLEN